MRLQLIRNATLILQYAGHRILIDPFFAPAHTLPSYIGGGDDNPLVELPATPENILRGVEMTIISHLHTDHFDKVGAQSLPQEMEIFCQPTNDLKIRERGFENVTVIEKTHQWHNIHITRIDGRHGSGEVETLMQKVSGFVLAAEGEPTLYWAGDTVLCDHVYAALDEHQPQVIVTHSCGAKWSDSEGNRVLIVMDAAQTIEVCRRTPNATVIATHMETLDHATVTREDLRERASQANIRAAQLRIPIDGEVILLNGASFEVAK